MLRGTRIGAVAGIVALAGVSGDAQAQQYSWNGIYVGGEAGGGWGRSDSTFLGDNACPFDSNGNPNPTCTYVNANLNNQGGPRPVGISGGLGGLNLGYLHQSGGLVLGLTGSYDWGKISGSEQIHETPDRFTSVDVKSLALLNGKIGVANGPWLAYATGGVAWGQLDVSHYGTCNNQAFCQTFSQDGSATRTGWDAGGGVAYALTNSVIVGVEYNHINLGKATIDQAETVNTGKPDSYFQRREYDPAIDVVKATLTYHFDTDRSSPAPLK